MRIRSHLAKNHKINPWQALKYCQIMALWALIHRLKTSHEVPAMLLHHFWQGGAWGKHLIFFILKPIFTKKLHSKLVLGLRFKLNIYHKIANCLHKKTPLERITNNMWPRGKTAILEANWRGDDRSNVGEGNVYGNLFKTRILPNKIHHSLDYDMFLLIF